jgi:N-acetyl-gamma-glutamyl-phosphate reductase
MTRAGIIGATGYTGAELVRILSGHPEIELTILTSRNYAGEKFARVYPAMAGVVDLECQSFDPDRLCDQTDIVFTALPHKLPMEIIPALIQRGKKVIDLSADFRFRDAAAYETYYQPHTAKDLLEQAVYGLSEIYFDRIKKAQLVGNPGCYPTSVLLPLIPFIKNGFLDLNTLIADAKSGVSGAGRSPSLATLFCEVHESFKAYKIAEHRHNPEMEEILSQEAGKPVNLTFTPHLVPMSRGMLTTVYAQIAKKVSIKDLQECIESFYSGRHFVRLTAYGNSPDTLHVRGTNYCDIGFKFDKRNNRLILLSAIDNLVKGAAGQAVQNMNIMLGLDETLGLANIPYPL